jgi:hypothetical protein
MAANRLRNENQSLTCSAKLEFLRASAAEDNAAVLQEEQALYKWVSHDDAEGSKAGQ